MNFFLYREPLYDEVSPIFLGAFKTRRDAEIARDNFINDDWYFYEDFYIIEEARDG